MLAHRHVGLTIGLLILLLPTASFAGTRSFSVDGYLSAESKNAHVAHIKKPQTQEILYDLRGVNLFVRVNSDQYVYNFPRELSPDTLTESLSAKINENLLSRVFADDKGDPLDFKVVSHVPSGHCTDITTPAEKISCAEKRLEDYVYDPANLTINVKISIENDITNETHERGAHPYGGPQDGPDPRIFVIKLNFFRPGCFPKSFDYSSAELEKIIPINRGPDEVASEVKGFLATFGSHLTWLVDNAAGMSDRFICEKR